MIRATGIAGPLGRPAALAHRDQRPAVDRAAQQRNDEHGQHRDREREERDADRAQVERRAQTGVWHGGEAVGRRQRDRRGDEPRGQRGDDRGDGQAKDGHGADRRDEDADADPREDPHGRGAGRGGRRHRDEPGERDDRPHRHVDVAGARADDQHLPKPDDDEVRRERQGEETVCPPPWPEMARITSHTSAAEAKPQIQGAPFQGPLHWRVTRMFIATPSPRRRGPRARPGRSRLARRTACRIGRRAG